MAQRRKRKRTEEAQIIALLDEEGFYEVTPEMAAKDSRLQRMVEDFERELALRGYNNKAKGSSKRRRFRRRQ